MSPTTRKQPKKLGYEFLGPPGAFLISFGLPVLLYAFLLLCNDVSGYPIPSLLRPSTCTLEKLKEDVNWHGFESIFNIKAFAAAVGFYAWSLFLYAILPAKEHQGVVLASGGRLIYRLNAWSSAIITLGLLAAGTAFHGADWVFWRFTTDNYVPLYTSNLLIGYILATSVYVQSFSVKFGDGSNRELAPGGFSGNMLYDWFIGRELNPRVKLPFIPEVDIKIWMELRTGLFGWIVLNLAFIAHQYRTFGYVTASIVLITGAQGLYVLDSLYMETAILTTIDTIHDGFGFMLAFADTAWIPFSYSLQARYLAFYPQELGAWLGWTLFALIVGYYIFRASNNEKDRFRTNPNNPSIRHLKYMETKSGSKLLTSGWWGRSRHPNYLGDWIMSWAFSLPTGFAGYLMTRRKLLPGSLPQGSKEMIPSFSTSPMVVYPGEAKGWGMIVTYFYVVYFAVLLIHRAARDDEKCKEKYGQDWEVYKKKVPYRIIPYIY